VQFTDVDSAHKLILVTSPSWGEGKTTTVCNLALALAEAGTSVLIIDADLRRASVASSLSIEKRAGLTDVLVGRIPIEQAVQPLAPALDVLPSGPLPPNPSELLGSNRMIKLIAGLRLMYEVVLIDTAPLLPVTDAAVLAPRVDGVLVLVRHGHTVGRDLRAAKDALDAVSGRIIGSVMTMVPHAGKRARRRKPRKGIRQQRPYGPGPGTGPGGETGSAVPGSALRQAASPQAASPQPASPQAASPQPAAPLPAPRQPSPAPRPSEPSDSGGQVLDRGPAAR
jgi:non-specific protein-tyrosine kinase